MRFEATFARGLITSTWFFILFKIAWKNKENNSKVFITTLPFLLHCLVEFPYYYWYLLMPFVFLIGVINRLYFDKVVIIFSRKYLLLVVFIFLLIYKFFYDEYESISRDYLAIYSKECKNPSRHNWVFFRESAKNIKYYCLYDSEKKVKRKIVSDSLNYTLLIDYIDTYPLIHDELSEYACSKYDYSC